MNIIENVVFAIMAVIMVCTAVYVGVQRNLEKKNIVRICSDGTRIYQYSDERFEAVGTGWYRAIETVPGPEICDK